MQDPGPFHHHGDVHDACLPFARHFPHSPEPAQALANAYDRAGHRYGLHADGDVRKLFAFDGKYAHGDRKTWDAIEIALRGLRASGKETLTVLDLGCGPGTRLRRTVTRARANSASRASTRWVSTSPPPS